MEKYCIICNNGGKYKCPICLVYYCSVGCCRKHRETGCEVIVKPPVETKASQTLNLPKLALADTVPMEKLMLLKSDSNLLDLLCNSHLRNLLITINDSRNPEETIQMAMQEPIFVEFVQTFMKIIEPTSEED